MPTFSTLNSLDSASKELIHAAARGENLLIAALLKQGVDPNFAGEDGYRAIHQAALNNRDDTVSILLAHGADPCLTSDRDEHLRGHNALHEAVSGGSFRAIVLLVRTGMDLEAFTCSGYTALNIAANRDYTDAINALLDAGANPHGARLSALSPLLKCAFNSNMDCMQRLLRVGAWLSKLDEDSIASPMSAGLLEGRKEQPGPKLLLAMIKARKDANEISLSAHSASEPREFTTLRV